MSQGGANGPRASAGAALLPLSLFAALVGGLALAPLPWRVALPWAPSLGLELTFVVDGLSAQFLVLITGIGALVLVYASGYMAGHPGKRRLDGLLLLFMLAMVGAVTADHALVFFLFFELTSLLSFLLIGFEHERVESRAAARQALLVTFGGGLSLLAGLLLLAHIGDTWSLRELAQRGASLPVDGRLAAAIVLLLVGCFTKSAQLPFSFWLPHAMQAPTPVSAYLHSSTMVKLGIFLLARLDPAFNEHLLWEAALVLTGGLTAVWGAALTFLERDMKRILARSTVAALGTLTLLIGLPNPGASLAVVAFVFAHALYKAALFFVVGNLDHATGTRRIDELRGLGRAMPWTAAAALLAAASMAGLPLTFGFVAKDLVSAAKVDTTFAGWVSYSTLVVNAVASAVAGIAAIRAFWGRPRYARPVHRPSWRMVLPPVVVAVIGIEFEVFPTLADPLLLEAARSIAPALEEVERVVGRYDVASVLGATGLTSAVGVGVFLAWDRLHRLSSPLASLERIGATVLYEGWLRAIAALAARQSRALQHGRLPGYVRVLLAGAIAAVVAAWLVAQPGVAIAWRTHEQGAAWLVGAALVAVGAVGAVVTRDRLALVMASGLVGYGCAALFLFAGAPDVALTQLAVETSLVVVITLALPHLGTKVTVPERPSLTTGALALVAGVGALALLLLVGDSPQDPAVERWIGDNAVVRGQGRNVVNVILVDFRALDTLGEIAVVAFALLAALPSLSALATSTRARPPRDVARPLLLHRAVGPLYWVSLAAALWLLLRGHNEPGGGFVAGLVAATASAAVAIVLGVPAARARMGLAPERMALVGVLLALVSGLPGMIAHGPFLHHLWWSLPVGAASVKVSTVLLFDLGVLLAVWGAVSGYVLALLGDGPTHSAAVVVRGRSS